MIAATPWSRWLRVFAPFALGYYLSYVLRTVNAVIAPDLTRELALTGADLGLLTSAYFLTFAAFQLPLGILLDRYGPRKVEAALLVLCALGTALFALGEGLTQLGFARALIGVGVSACLMAALKSFHQWFPHEQQPSLMGAIMVAGTLGALTASLPLEAALPLLGWRGVFWALTVLALAVAAIVLTVPEHQAGITTEGFAAQLRGVARVFTSAVFWRFAPQTCFVVGGFMALQSLWAVPWLMTVSGCSRAQAAGHLFYLNLALLLGYFGVATLSARLARRGIKPVALLSAGTAAAIAIGLLIVLDAGPTPLLWAGLGLAMCTGNLSYPLLTARFPADLAGRVNTALNLLAFVGAFGLQWGFGAVLDLLQAGGTSPAHSYRFALGILLAAQAVSFVWFIVSGCISGEVRAATSVSTGSGSGQDRGA